MSPCQQTTEEKAGKICRPCQKTETKTKLSNMKGTLESIITGVFGIFPKSIAKILKVCGKINEV